MRQLILVLVLMTGGCHTLGNSVTVVGTAYVESDRPEGKAGAKVEVRYTPKTPRAPEAWPPPESAGPCAPEKARRSPEVP